MKPSKGCRNLEDYPGAGLRQTAEDEDELPKSEVALDNCIVAQLKRGPSANLRPPFHWSLCAVVHGWCAVANSSCPTAAAVVHDVHDACGSRGNSKGGGSGAQGGAKKVSSLFFLIFSLKTKHNDHNVHNRCAAAVYLFVVCTLCVV